jgi:hypothetical protein
MHQLEEDVLLTFSFEASPQNTCINQLQFVGCEVRQYFVKTAGAKPKVNSDKNIT